MILLPLILFAILFRKQARELAIVVLLIVAVSMYYAASFWHARYAAWVACGEPTVSLCAEGR